MGMPLPSYETYQRIHRAMEYIYAGKLDLLEKGRHDLDDEIYVNVMEYDTKTEGIFESHHRYIDIHYVICGEEKIEIAPEEQMKVTQEYQDDGDYVLGHAEGETYTLHEKQSMVVMPGEAHVPGLMLRDIQHVKKAVVKVPF